VQILLAAEMVAKGDKALLAAQEGMHNRLDVRV
jgi:hypothetical protein